MNNIDFQLNDRGHGAFYIVEEGARIAEMIISISHNILTVHHTEVMPSGEGKGLGKQLFATMVEYARKNNLKVIAICPFVHAQFKRHEKEYSDIWLQPDK